VNPNGVLRVAIVGSGPAGFYTADALFKAADVNAEVDMLDRVPTPWGLVRAGVAPDHPNIKAVSRVYEKIAKHPGFRFYGHVDIGSDVSRDELLERYHLVVYAFGAKADRRMGIPGEDLEGSWPATDFVAWYNGHPDYHHLEFDISCERAIVVGNGNVAADVARMLALTYDELAVTDVSDYALEVLRDAAIREIVVLGRRGPVQAAFTTPELLELGELADADVYVDPRDVELDPVSAEALASGAAGPTARKNVEVLREYAKRAPEGKRKRLVLRFATSPVAIEGDGKVESITVCRNELVPDGSGSVRARATDETELIPAGIVFRSIGYRGTPLAGAPFDERGGVIPNERGRVVDPERGDQLLGEYAVGWIKRGPTGIIGTNKKDAQETVTALLEDVAAGRFNDPRDPDRDAADEFLRSRKPELVSYAGWEEIDRVERARGEPQGRPRVKLCTYDEMLEMAAGAGTLAP
jgi:ferredoxin/flavodoxin---NADP+ reductase